MTADAPHPIAELAGLVIDMETINTAIEALDYLPVSKRDEYRRDKAQRQLVDQRERVETVLAALMAPPAEAPDATISPITPRRRKAAKGKSTARAAGATKRTGSKP